MQDHFTHFTPVQDLIKHFGLRGLTAGINTASGQVLEQVIHSLSTDFIFRVLYGSSGKYALVGATNFTSLIICNSDIN